MLWQDVKARNKPSPDHEAVIVFYATREGHTRRIADAIARGLARFGLQTSIVDLGRPASEDLDRYDAVVLASPVHMDDTRRRRSHSSRLIVPSSTA